MRTLNKFNNNSPIAFFDSGVGGLTVLNKVKAILPNESCVYYGDTLHMPYGEKTKEQLLDYSDKIFRFFESIGCKAVVMACNTTSSVIYNDVKDKYNFKLFPIVQSVSEMLAELPISRLGIFATRATIISEAYQNEISKYNDNMQIFGQYCPDWVHIVENNLINDQASRNIVKSDIEKMLLNNPERIVLGCTHYPYLINVLSEFAPINMFIDPAVYFAQYIKTELQKNNLLATSNNNVFDTFYVSSKPEKFKESSKMFYKLASVPELIIL